MTPALFGYLAGQTSLLVAFASFFLAVSIMHISIILFGMAFGWFQKRREKRGGDHGDK
jgi:hypothetical protein